MKTEQWKCAACDNAPCTHEAAGPFYPCDGRCLLFPQRRAVWARVEKPEPKPVPALPQTLDDVPAGTLCSCSDGGYLEKRYWRNGIGETFYIASDGEAGITARHVKYITVAEILGRVVITHVGATSPELDESRETVAALEGKLAAKAAGLAAVITTHQKGWERQARTAKQVDSQAVTIQRLQAENEKLKAENEKNEKLCHKLHALGKLLCEQDLPSKTPGA